MSEAFVRRAIFWIAALWILLSPGWVQLGFGRGGVIRPWQMYSGVGRGLCDVHFYSRTEDGDVYLPRLATSKPGVPLHEIGGNERRVELDEIAAIGRRLCTQSKSTDVRADARCANSKGWKKEMRRDKNLCRPQR